MNAEQLRTDIESNLLLRQDEIRFYQNQVELAPVGAAKDRMRRALILLLYAHFEGFTKLALTLYVTAINAEHIACSDAETCLVAATLFDEFNSLRNPQPVAGAFRGANPEDSKLMRFARERTFVEAAYKLLEREVVMSPTLIETEGNLRPRVLRKLLFRLGFDTESYTKMSLNCLLPVKYFHTNAC